jgi:hypothetical protein
MKTAIAIACIVFGGMVFGSLDFRSPAPADLAAKCVGASPCRACKSCSSCKHCNSGGSCGTCRRLKGGAVEIASIGLATCKP